MKILGIVGSPRKNGNTHVLVEHVLVERVLEGARQAGAETEIVLLGDLQILECDGCHACWKTGKCVKKDDMSGLYSRIAASDAIVFGTPVYWYAATALMKAFVDRFVFFNCPGNRPGVRGKAAAIVVPLEEQSPEVAAGVVEFFRKSLQYLEMDLRARLVVPGVTRRGEAAAQPKVMEEALEVGKRLAR